MSITILDITALVNAVALAAGLLLLLVLGYAVYNSTQCPSCGKGRPYQYRRPIGERRGAWYCKSCCCAIDARARRIAESQVRIQQVIDSRRRIL